MKARKLISSLQTIASSNSQILGPVDFIVAGPYSLSGCNLSLDDENLISRLGIHVGIYIIASTEDEILYIGVSNRSITHRIWQRLQAVTWVPAL